MPVSHDHAGHQAGRPARASALLGVLLATTALSFAGPAAAAVYPVAVDNSLDRLMQDLVVPPTASTAGMWSTVAQWPLVGLHVSVLPTGQVLSYGATGVNGGTQDGRTLDVWNPSGGLILANHADLADPANIDSFCGTGALLANGTALLSGGSASIDNDSSKLSTLFSPQALATAALTTNLASPRWYASMITLPDGRDLISGGGLPYVTNAYTNPAAFIAGNEVSMTPEVYTAGQGWTSLLGANSETAFGPDDNRWWYPRQFVAPGGNVFGLSVNQYWSLSTTGTGGLKSIGTFKTTYSETTLPNVGPTSTASMYQPGLVLQAGGNGRFNGDATTSSPRASVLDARVAGAETFHDVASMTYPRQWANSVVLPNDTVLVTGGTTFADNAGGNAIYAAEMWNPATQGWTVGASAAIYRGYHSATTLLPDGAVLSSGGGVPGPVTNTNAEIYYPPYLFTANPTGGAMLAQRPTLVSLSAATLGYGARLGVELGSAAGISKVALIRLGVTTHSFNSGQAYVNPAFQQTGNLLTVTMPASGAIAPPGYYQVIALDTNGVPSRGAIIGLGTTITAPPAAPAVAAPLPAPFTSTGIKAVKVVSGEDGSVAYLTPGNVAMLRPSASAAWQQLPGQMRDLAIVNAGSIYGIGMDTNVYRWTKASAAWQQVGVNVSSIAASADGAVIVTNSFDHSIWFKPTDDYNANWSRFPSYAKRVALGSKTSAWMIGLDGNVYHGGAAGWTQVGYAAEAISAKSYAMAVLNNVVGTIWVKNAIGNDADYGFSNVAGNGNELSLNAGSSMWLIDANGTLAFR